MRLRLSPVGHGLGQQVADLVPDGGQRTERRNAVTDLCNPALRDFIAAIGGIFYDSGSRKSTCTNG